MSLAARAKAIIRACPERMAMLEAAGELGLKDWALGAGFVRNAIWDHLHDQAPSPLNDVDLVYLDREDAGAERDLALEAQLHEQRAAPWSVKNQARMHHRHGHRPYPSTLVALGHWLEVATCVGVRLEKSGELTLLAPFGLSDNFALLLRVNPLNARPALMARRVADKGWRHRWPRLTVL